MSGRAITYDEIQLEVLARHDLSEEDRVEVLKFIRDFKQQVRSDLLTKYIPERLRDKMEVKVSQ